MSSFCRVLYGIFAIIIITKSAYKQVTEECPDPNLRSEYDPNLAYNKRLDPSKTYQIHPRSSDIVARIAALFVGNKAGLSMPIPMFTYSPDTNWATYSVIYGPSSKTATWTTFRCPGASEIASVGDPGGHIAVDNNGNGVNCVDPGGCGHDFPFILRDPDHPTHGKYTELRGYHTYIDHTNQKIYCEGCGLFKYNNDGTTIAPNTGPSMGDNFDHDPNGSGKGGQGTGCGLSWPGVIRRTDVLSGVIAHALRAPYPSCDFYPTTDSNVDYFVAPAIKTDQPKSCGGTTADYYVLMGYRMRLKTTVNCASRLAPKYENNGKWQQPTAQITSFVRMFCVALQEYGFILSDGMGASSTSTVGFQAESHLTANWSEVFGATCDQTTCGSPTDEAASPHGWSWMIRDWKDTYTWTDNRYRDERYGIPWDQLEVLDVSDVGDVNNCCLNSSLCTTAPTPTPTPWTDTTSGPTCMNEFCCFKHRTIKTSLRINDDNCVIYNVIFTGTNENDIIKIYAKRDGTAANNTLIASNTFQGTTKDAVHVEKGTYTMIKDNTFPATIPSGWHPVRVDGGNYVTIKNNNFGPSDGDAIHLNGATLDDVKNTLIIGNTFTGVKADGILIQGATDTTITQNNLTNIEGSGVRENYEATPNTVSNGVDIDGNIFDTNERGIYISYDSGVVKIRNNEIKDISGFSSSHGIEFAGTSDGAIIDNNIITNCAKSGIVASSNNNNMQILNNHITNMQDNKGITLSASTNFLIKNNVISVIGDTGTGIYVESYGTIDGNTIYSVTRRGIQLTGTSASTGALIIQNNIIYATIQGSIKFYYNGGSPSSITVKFNTLVNHNGQYAVEDDSGFNSVSVYGNILVANAGKFIKTVSGVVNYEKVYSSITDVKFIALDATTLSNTNLHIQSTSPAIEYCSNNNLDLNTYPLVTNDIDGNTRPSTAIDAGADQVSAVSSNPTVATTANPTGTPTNNPTRAPTNQPTSAPTDAPTPTTSAPTKNPTRAPTGNPTRAPTNNPTHTPTNNPTDTTGPTKNPTINPTTTTNNPTSTPTQNPTKSPTNQPNHSPTSVTKTPTRSPTGIPTSNPTRSPTDIRTDNPTRSPTDIPTNNPTSTTNNPTQPPTSVPTVSSTVPQCTNSDSDCCYKDQTISTAITIAKDNCVIYNCVFNQGGLNDVITISAKSDGTASDNTLIYKCTFTLTTKDAIDVVKGTNTMIKENTFPTTISGSYNAIKLRDAIDTTIQDNTFNACYGNAVYLIGTSSTLTSIQNTIIQDNTFDGPNGDGILIEYATNTIIRDNTFKNIGETGVRLKYQGSVNYISNGVEIDGNTWEGTSKRGIYISYDSGTVKIKNNILTGFATSTSNGIEFSGGSSGAIVENNTITNCEDNGIQVSVSNNNMQILNNRIDNTQNNKGITILGSNFLIKNNIISNIGSSGTSGIGIYVKSYGVIDGNIIYDSTKRAILYQGSSVATGGELIIQNNFIYGTNQDSFVFYGPGTTCSTAPTAIKLRFNTIVNDRDNYMAIKGDNNFCDFDIYCNIIVATATDKYIDTDYSSTSSVNYKQLYSSISTVKFVTWDVATLSNTNLHIQSSSPAVEYCSNNNLDLNTYPLVTNDIDGNSRLSTAIDAGADQISTGETANPTRTTGIPTNNPTRSPTGIPTNNPTSPTDIRTDNPTRSPTDIPTTNPTSTTNNPTTSPTDNPTPGPTNQPINQTPSLTTGCGCYDYTVTGTHTITQDNCVIDQCTFEFGDDGLEIADGVENVEIKNSVFKSGSGTSRTRDCIETLGTVTDIYIHNNIFDGCTRRAIVLGSDVSGNNNKITDNTIKNLPNSYHAIEFLNGISSGIEISGNIFNNLKKNAIDIASGNNHINVKITNNEFTNVGQNSGYHAIEIETTGFEISNNIISNTNDDAIYVKSFGIINNNIIYDAGDFGIYFNDQTPTGTTAQPLIIENNIIYEAGDNPIRLSSTTDVVNEIYVRFNTLIKDNQPLIDISSSYENPGKTYIYCNILVREDTTSDYYDTSANYIFSANNIEANNLQNGNAIPNIKFQSYSTSSTTVTGSNVNLHLSTSETSSAEGYCKSSTNSIDTSTYPIINYDIDLNTRSDTYDAGAHQKTGVTSAPTTSPTSTTTEPTSAPVGGGGQHVDNDNNSSHKNDNSIIYYIIIIFCSILVICAIIIIYYQCYIVKKLKKNNESENNNNNNNNRWVDAATPITPITPLTMAKQIELQKINENGNENANKSSFGAAVKRVYKNQFKNRENNFEAEGYKLTSKHEVVPSSSVFKTPPGINDKNIQIIPPKIKIVNTNNNNNINNVVTPTTPLKISDQMEEQMDLTPILDESQTFID